MEATTTECVSPRFGEAAYKWEAYEDGASGEALTAEATGPNDDTIIYSITAGEANQFRIADHGPGLRPPVSCRLGPKFKLCPRLQRFRL